MIGLPDGVSIYLYTQPVDFRKGFDGLTGIVTGSLGQKVTSGSLFLFVNRKRDRIKALWWETGGLTVVVQAARAGNGRVAESPKQSVTHHDRFSRAGDVDRRRVARLGQETTQANESCLKMQKRFRP